MSTEMKSKSLEQLIKSGETAALEFKKTLSDSRKIVETIGYDKEVTVVDDNGDNWEELPAFFHYQSDENREIW